MAIIEKILGIVFFMAIGLSMFSTVAFSSKPTRIMLIIPWAAVAAGIGYYVFASWYFSLPEISVTVPIRLDIPILAPFLLYALYVGFSSILKAGGPAPPKKSEDKEK